MIDPLLSLAFSLHAHPGAYALLLGSGVSRAAEIPTGWEVVLALVRKLARLEGEDDGTDPAAWFRARYQAEPDYSKLLDALCPTPAERQAVLRGYFEPGEEDQRLGRKLPTAAHRAIARLVSDGYVRVILTTNFDRLIERALEEVGVAPSVISSSHAARGALPLAHARATVIKLHGDYLDLRIKNTPKELASYERDINRLLDRVFDEYELIVCGWSGEWDIALRAALERCSVRRFTTFWAGLTAREQPPDPEPRGPRPSPSEARDAAARTLGLADAARRLVQSLAAQLIPIQGADDFFEAVRERIQALEEFVVPHPVDARLAGVRVKRLLADAPPHVRLHDLIHAETERAFAALDEQRFPATAFQFTAEEEDFAGRWPSLPTAFWLCTPRFQEVIADRARRYEALLDVLLSAVMTGIRWGGPSHAALWVRSIERLGNPAFLAGLWERLGTHADLHQPAMTPTSLPAPNAQISVASRLNAELGLFPALLLTWGAGLAATATGDGATLAALLRQPRLFTAGEQYPLLPSLPFLSVGSKGEAGALPDLLPVPWIELDNLRSRWDTRPPPVPERLSACGRVAVPITQHLYDFFRLRMQDWLPLGYAYRACFARFLHLATLVPASEPARIRWAQSPRQRRDLPAARHQLEPAACQHTNSLSAHPYLASSRTTRR